ncbi:hypothetical protein CH373_14595 [Leptospira perolatii]|uniref:Uncharacterized protein n=1 Tax=Leptospira perolatii TaxID=2023191 RepID=A0A2M9ZJZ1_9LEPT|nr:hypothetical protein [Leptospira perolatii]PJZ69241.1 hypothetical protein CH360_12025 [Leptospira perolatii]PJZ72377.1 hypothetical protein CH373_14595 [Leptospira perolatii]
MEFLESKDESENKSYRIRLTVAIYRNNILSYKNDIVVPSFYPRRNEARAHISREVKERLAHSSFFRSPRPDYDLVRYSEEATCNTFLRYRIVQTTSTGESISRSNP